jgi:hypothetical protein
VAELELDWSTLKSWRVQHAGNIWGTEMFNRLKLIDPQDRSYDPELLKLMQTAYDEAWQMQGLDGSPAHEAAREHLAKAILDVVDHGERDPVKIRSYALGELLRFRNDPPAPS